MLVSPSVRLNEWKTHLLPKLFKLASLGLSTHTFGGAKELGIVYINIKRGAKEPRNLQNHRGAMKKLGLKEQLGPRLVTDLLSPKILPFRTRCLTKYTLTTRSTRSIVHSGNSVCVCAFWNPFCLLEPFFAGWSLEAFWSQPFCSQFGQLGCWSHCGNLEIRLVFRIQPHSKFCCYWKMALFQSFQLPGLLRRKFKLL